MLRNPKTDVLRWLFANRLRRGTINTRKWCLFILIFLAGLAIPGAPLLGSPPPSAAKAHNDPYSVLHNHYRAIGGLDRLKRIKTTYLEGDARYDKLRGKFRHWGSRPLQFRAEEDYKTISQIRGDNGQYSWIYDTNGQVLIHKTPEVMERREIARLMDKYEHLNRKSPFFSVSYQGLATINNILCYTIRIDNAINSDTMIFYFDTSTFLLVRSSVKQPDATIITTFDDYRKQGNLILSFHQFTKYLPREKEEETWIKRYIHNPIINRSIFNIPTSKKDYRFTGADKNKKSVSIPFLFIENMIYLPVTIGDDTKFWVLDSGASMSVIDEDYGAELGLQKDGTIQGYGFGELFELSFVTVPQQKIGTIVFDSQNLYGTKGLAKDSYEPVIHGILGYDFLSRFIVEINYDARMVTLHRPDNFTYDGPGVVIDAPLKYRTFSLPVVLNGKYKSRWSLDLGAYQSTIYYQFAEKHNLLNIPGVDTVSQGLSSVSIGTTSQFSCLAIDRFTLNSQLLNIPPFKGKGATALGEVGGNLGNSTLQHFHLWLNYRDQQLILEPGSNFNINPPRDKSGILIGLSADDQPMVSFVASNTPAEAGGVLAGDIIVGFNGTKVGPGYPSVTLRNLLRKEAGTPVKLKLLRDTELVSVVFTLQDLYPQDQRGCSTPP